ncbi:MAG TPA: glycosyltransferase [Isosphaeraceae bacterium]|jgi:UDP:flavonoid glycosyltransferase YjiC (YdhE family)
MGDRPPPAAPGAGGRRRRVLFVSEAVTLAHVARPFVLSRGLDPTRYETILAAAPRYEALFGDWVAGARPIRSIPSEQFLGALARGQPVYDAATLGAYVREDLEVIRETAPDVVVGDFRLSLSVSARVAGVPYLTVTNAYWSPYAHQRFPMPELPLSRRLGVGAARVLFDAVRPLAFALHTRPLNRVRRDYGLPSLGLDLRRVYTDADWTLYADVPELAPTVGLPAHHHYLGPILWSPDGEPPAWWAEVPRDRPAVYVTLGSSGRGALLDAALEALAPLPVSVLAATVRSGAGAGAGVPENAWVAPFLPGREAAARARLVLCNGGSPATHQALAVGTPVLGLAGNMDQHLNMVGIERRGAGRLLRSEHARPAAIRATVAAMLDDPKWAEAAAAVATIFARYDAVARFRSLVDAAAGVPG